MSDLYNSGSVPHGSRVESIINGGGTVGSYKFENITITRTATKIERKGVDAAAADWVAVAGYATMSATIQVATSATTHPRQGDWIIDTFDLGAAEKFVILETSPSFVAGDYRKVSATLHKDHNYTP